MTDKIKINYNDQFSYGSNGMVMKCYMMNDPAKCYVSWSSEKPKFSHDKLKKFLDEAGKNDDFMRNDISSALEILEIPYYVHDDITEKDVFVFHMPSLMMFCSCVRTVYMEDNKSFSKELISYIDNLVYLLIGCGSDMLTIQSVKWRKKQQSKLVGRNLN